MKISATNLKISDIFNRKVYTIPKYQRNYSWRTEEEIQLFWDDLIYYLNSPNNPNFFIGPMVFKGDGLNASEYEVIDGQQRLITISILFSVLIFFFKKYNRHDLSDGLVQYLVYKDVKSTEHLVINTIEPHPFFQKRVFHGDSSARPVKQSELLISKAWDFFYSNISDILSEKKSSKEQKLGILEKVQNYIFNIDTVLIVSDDETDAFTIFETINTRGKNLTSFDLLKNYIQKSYEHKTGVTELEKNWETVVKNIETDPENFFNRFWASWVGKIPENKLYRRFNDYIRSSANTKFKSTKILMDELLFASEIYRKITRPSLEDWRRNRNLRVYYHIKNINGLFKVKVHIPFFLALFEEYDNKNLGIDLLNKALLLMEDFHFIFTHIASSRPSGLDSKYSKHAIKLRERKNKSLVIEELKAEFLSKIPEKEEYIEKFKKLDFNKNKDTIKFILLRLEKTRDDSLTPDLDLNSIEHLAPRSSKLNNRNNIGNLFLLEEKYNNVKADKMPFGKNKTNDKTIIELLCENTKYKSTKTDLESIKNKGVWDEKSIDLRTQQLAEETYKIFSKLKMSY